jgi:SAM-dependent methyltransferase
MIKAETGGETVQFAYDRIAHGYDQQVAGDAWMRAILWQHYARLFRPGDHILDVSCGTGLDAVFLARAGMRVTGIDISPEMIAQLRARVAQENLDTLIEAQVLDLANLVQLPTGEFDGIVSAFAGLSTSPDLTKFAGNAARLLKPNGRMLIHMLNRFSLWEWLALIAHRRWGDARRLGSERRRTFTIGGLAVEHRLYYPLDAYQQFFANEFQIHRAYALGVLRPPHTMRAVPERGVRALEAIDERFGAHRPWLNRGRFFVLELLKRPSDDRER